MLLPSSVARIQTLPRSSSREVNMSIVQVRQNVILSEWHRKP